MADRIDSKHLQLDRLGYKWKGQRFQRVTTIKGKKGTGSALVDWAARMVAERAQDYAEAYREGRIDKKELLVRLMSDELKNAHNEVRDDAADFGTVFHRLVENIARGDGDSLHVAEAEIAEATARTAFARAKARAPKDATELRTWTQSKPEGLAGAVEAAKARLWPDVEAFLEWHDSARPEWLLNEFTVLSRTLGYMGTCDAVARIWGRRVMLDLKTSKSVYSDYSLQLAAYRFAEFVCDPETGAESPVPEVDACAVLHVRDGRCVLYDVPAGKREFDAFAACHSLYWFDRDAPKEFSPFAPQPVLEALL